MELTQLAIVFVCLAMGGVLKGATGAGAPLLAIPAMAMMFDVRVAVVVMLMPNLLTNIWQGWRFRADLPPGRFAWRLAIAGAAGVVVGTVMLASFPQSALSLLVAFAVLLYLALRIGRPDWRITFAQGNWVSAPVGAVAGVLQGASGISAPVSLTFLHAMRLERSPFIATISVFFVTMTLLQFASLAVLGLVAWRELAISFAAMAPILAFMPVGGALARRFSPKTFDRLILALLSALSLKLIHDALIG